MAPLAHGFGGEQVGRAHEHPQPGAPRRQRRADGRHRGGRSGVVDAAGEQHVQVLGVLHRAQPLDLGLPQREAGPGPDVAAALATLEHEPPSPVLDEPVEQARGRHVEVGGDAGGLQGRGLGGAAPGDQGHRGMGGLHHGQLLLAQLGRDEAQDPDPPGPVAQQLGGLGQQRFDLRTPHQGQSQEGQAAAVGHRGGEGGLVADPRHRALGDRVSGPVRLGHAAAGPQGSVLGGLIQVRADGPAHGLDDAARGLEAVGQPGRGRAVLAHGDQIGAQIRTQLVGHHHARLARVAGGHGQIRPRVDAMAADHPRLAAVHGRDGGPGGSGQAALAHQGQLAVEHHASGAEGDGAGGGVQADPAAGPDRHAQPDGVLEQHEGLHRPDPAAALGALGHQSPGAEGHGQAGVGHRGDLDHHPGPRGPSLDGRPQSRRPRPGRPPPRRRAAPSTPAVGRAASEQGAAAARDAPGRRATGRWLRAAKAPRVAARRSAEATSTTATAPARAAATARVTSTGASGRGGTIVRARISSLVSAAMRTSLARNVDAPDHLDRPVLRCRCPCDPVPPLDRPKPTSLIASPPRPDTCTTQRH